MYGTVARLQVLPGKVEELRALMNGRDVRERQMKGFVTSTIYQADGDPDELWLAVAFESREAYHANAGDPAQDVEYRKMRALLAVDPEWHDGEIVDSITAGS